MNYYPHHIGDFNSATRHLTRVERSLYRDLIELYYDTEQPLPADDFDRLARRVIAQTDEEKDGLRYVLDEFFVIDGDVYRHERCDEEIQKYQSQIAAKSNAGKASAKSRQAKKEAQQPLRNKQTSNTNEQPLNSSSTDEQLTKNQEPRTNTSDTDVSGAGAPAKPVEIIFGRGVPLLTASGVSEKNARSMLGMLRKTHGDEDVIAALQACADSQALEPVAYLQGVLRAAKGATRPRTNRAEDRANWMASFWQPTQPPMKDMGVIHASSY